MSEPQQLFRLRINHREAGRLSWLSHLELARAMERVLRRSNLPYASTQGFSPHMRIAFGPALPVGVGGIDEYVDVWLTSYVDPQEAFEALSKAAPRELSIHGVQYVSLQEASLTAAYVLYTYEARMVMGESAEEALPVIAQAFDAFVAQGSMSVERKGKTKVLPFDEMLAEAPHCSLENDQVLVRFVVRSTNNGAIRPDVFCSRALQGLDGVTIRSISRVSLAIDTAQ